MFISFREQILEEQVSIIQLQDIGFWYQEWRRDTIMYRPK